MEPVVWPELAAHRERLLKIARRRCPSREDAEDVVSEALLRCATFEGLDPERLGPFLTTVTLRLCADLYRSADRHERALVRACPVDDHEPGPEDAACRAADAAVIAELLGRLPERQRAVLIDRAVGLPMPVIARRHALTYKAAESALSRARATMRGALTAALAGVTALGALLRPRRLVAVSAVPVSALLVVEAVLHLPAPPREQALPLARRPRVEVAVAPSPDAPRAAPPAVVAGRPPGRPDDGGHRPRRGSPSPSPTPTRSPEVVLPGPQKEEIDLGEIPEPREYAQRCTENGAYVQVENRDALYVDQGCYKSTPTDQGRKP